MPTRLRLYDCRLSRLPELVGKCVGDTVSIANFVNSAQRRLLMCKEAGDEGWYGTFAEVQFNGISRTTPYITLPREIARLEALNICKQPVAVSNQFTEYLQFGNGRLPKTCPRDVGCDVGVYSRNNAVTFVNVPAGSILRVYTTNAADYTSSLRILLQGTDTSDSVIYSQDGANQVQGIFLNFNAPFVQTPIAFNTITGIQKDQTYGTIQIFAVDSSGNQTLIHTMEPSEMVASYRRYYLNSLPNNCCGTGPVSTVSVTAIAKLDLIPVVVDTDYLLFNNLEAIIEECCAVRYSEMDNATAKAMAAEKHMQAVRLLNGEITHYLGKDTPAVSFHPFGSAKLERVKISMI